MYERKFSKWQAWPNRNDLDRVIYPGVYTIAHCDKDISNRKFTWRPEIIYIGMTNAVLGLKGRLKQFDHTIIGKRGHGGADRVRYKYPNYDRLAKRLFVAVAPFKCDVTSNHPQDLRVMGNVARFEYDCLAHYVERFGRVPQFNDKKESPKYSKTHGRK